MTFPRPFPGAQACLVVPDIDGQPEARPLDLAAPNGFHRIAEHEAGNDIGAAGDRDELDVELDAFRPVVRLAISKKQIFISLPENNDLADNGQLYAADVEPVAVTRSGDALKAFRE